MAQFTQNATSHNVYARKSVDAVNKVYFGSDNMNMSYHQTRIQLKRCANSVKILPGGGDQGGGGGVRPNP